MVVVIGRGVWQKRFLVVCKGQTDFSLIQRAITEIDELVLHFRGSQVEFLKKVVVIFERNNVQICPF